MPSGQQTRTGLRDMLFFEAPLRYLSVDGHTPAGAQDLFAVSCNGELRGNPV